MAPTNQRAHLGTHVKKRRLQLQLSVAGAARDTGIARGTWIAVEDGKRDTEELTYARIERTLQWAPGSIKAILDGGNPTPGEPSHTTVTDAGGDWLARLEAIRDNPQRSQHLRDMAAAQITQLRALLAAAEAEEDATRHTGT